MSGLVTLDELVADFYDSQDCTYTESAELIFAAVKKQMPEFIRSGQPWLMSDEADEVWGEAKAVLADRIEARNDSG